VVPTGLLARLFVDWICVVQEKTPEAIRIEDQDRLVKAEAEMAAAQEHMEEMRKMIAAEDPSSMQQ
jgi:hypothetical protein